MQMRVGKEWSSHLRQKKRRSETSFLFSELDSSLKGRPKKRFRFGSVLARAFGFVVLGKAGRREEMELDDNSTRRRKEKAETGEPREK